MLSDDAPEPIDNWTIRVGDTTYTVAIFPADGKLVGSWRCPICERRQEWPRRTDTHMEAVDCAEVEVQAHHKAFMTKRGGISLTTQPNHLKVKTVTVVTLHISVIAAGAASLGALGASTSSPPASTR